MEMIIDFPKGLRVDAHLGKFTIRTDQPLSSGGEETAPTPFALFWLRWERVPGRMSLVFADNAICRRKRFGWCNVRSVIRLQV